MTITIFEDKDNDCDMIEDKDNNVCDMIEDNDNDNFLASLQGRGTTRAPRILNNLQLDAAASCQN